jgi:hypothetical protein
MKTTFKKAKTSRKPNYDAIRKAKEAKDAACLQAIGASAMTCITEMVAAFNDAGDDQARETAHEAIHQDALSVEVRGDWQSPGDTSQQHATEYRILLSTGGPATRISGELDQYGEPTTARLEAQDWFTPWTEYRDANEDVLLEYARVFYFGV